MNRYLLYSHLAVLALLTACATPSFEDAPSAEFGDAQLYPVSSTGFNEVHARRDANLPKYSEILVEKLDVSDVSFSGPLLSGTTAGQWQITERRGETLQNAWRSAMDLAFRDYRQVEQGKEVLRITSRLVAVQRRHASVTGTLPSGMPSNRRDSVTIFIEIRLYDLASGQLLSVIRDRRDRHTEEWILGSGQHMESLFKSWTALLQVRIAGR